MQDFARKYGFASTLGDAEVQCGVPGEDFKVCRQCEESGDFKNFAEIVPMLSRNSHREWMNSFKEQVGQRRSDFTAGTYEIEAYMNHVRESESQQDFTKRIDENWGENYLFAHRQVIKMFQMELTLLGKPCLVPWDEFPKRWDNEHWPAPRGETAQEELDLANKLFEETLSEDFLKGTTLNQLGLRLHRLSELFGQVYAPTEDQVANQCQPERNSLCDRMDSNLSAHVNPIYWQIHLAYDKVIGEWLEANNLSQIDINCDLAPSTCYEWKGTFTNGYPF